MRCRLNISFWTPLLAAIALLAPASALASSAGDQQYTDPLAGTNTGGSSHSTQPPANTGTPPSQSPSSGAGSSAASSPAAITTPVASVASSQGAGTTLPYTGLDTGLVAILGGVLLAAGLSLRRRYSRRM